MLADDDENKKEKRCIIQLFLVRSNNTYMYLLHFNDDDDEFASYNIVNTYIMKINKTLNNIEERERERKRKINKQELFYLFILIKLTN